MEEKTEEKKEIQVEERYSLAEVVTQTGIAVKDKVTGVALDDKAILVEILNKLEKIENGVV